MDNDQSNPNVSLPGAAADEDLDPAIIQVLNKNVITDKHIEAESSHHQDHNLVNSDNKESTIEEDTTPSSSHQSNVDNIFDIESHLIETFENLSTTTAEANPCGVGGVEIKELPPAEDELKRNSQIESDTSPKTVIEVEPAVPKILQKVEVKLEAHNIGVATIIVDNEDEHLLKERHEFRESSKTESEENNEVLEDTQVLETQIEEDEEQSFETIDESLKSPALIRQIIKDSEKKEDLSCSHIESKSEANIPPDTQPPSTLSSEDVLEKSQILENPIDNKEKPAVFEDILKTEESEISAIIKDNSELKEDSEDIHLKQEDLKTPEQQEKSYDIQQTHDDLKENSKEIQLEHTEFKTADKTNENLILNENIKEDNLSQSADEYKTSTQKQPEQLSIDINGLPLPSTPLEEEERKRFLDSIPHLKVDDNDSVAVSKKAKKEYYQSLRKYLVHEEEDKPPVPIQTYRWEDLRRARERGGYPWTHLYKRPLGSEEEPEIVLLLRKSQEFRFHSESPKSLKKVRIHDTVLVQETERYIQELEEEEDEQEQEEVPVQTDSDAHSLRSESISVVSDSFLTSKKPSKLQKIKGILKRSKGKPVSPDTHSIASAPVPNSKKEESPKKGKFFYPVMDKIKGLADKHIKRRHIKKISLKKNDKVELEEQKIIKLKGSPKAQRSEIPHFEKQDSDDILEIVELDESPSRKRKDNLDDTEDTCIPVPDEIIELPSIPAIQEPEKFSPKQAPKKAPRLRREHVYEDIEDEDLQPTIEDQIIDIIELASVEALKKSLATQDQAAIKDVEVNRSIPLDRMGSSEEEIEQQKHMLAPISSIDSTSDDERKPTALPLSPVSEESDIAESEAEPELKPSIKRESSPCPSDRKVTFSHIEDEAEPHREDVELPEEVKEVNSSNRWAKMTDHEYEPIGEPETYELEKPSSAEVEATSKTEISTEQHMDVERDEHPGTPEGIKEARELQEDLEDRYFSSATTTPRSESRTETEIHTSQVDSSALEELPLKAENRRKTFMANAQDKGRRVKAGLSSQAGKIRTKIRGMKKPQRSPKGSPKAKERKRFKAPDFSKIKMPEIRKPDMPKFRAPDMSKLKDFKRPEFTKFSKPDMSKFKMPEKFSTLKLRRSKSFKEEGKEPTEDVVDSAKTISPKKKFDFTFGTYPRRSKTKEESIEVNTPNETPSAITTETAPSIESSTILHGDRGPGPVRSRWADKFSDASFVAGSDTSRMQRLGSSEQESFDRESSLERRMAEVLDQADKEDEELRNLASVEHKQFAEFDEENRAIHEMTQFRAGELKRRPMVHQDSDLISEESKDVGWSEKDILKNKMLKQAEIDSEGYMPYPNEEDRLSGSINTNQETQSTASSAARKFVIEEIDDDEFFIRKRGISQDNIEIRQYISSAIREGFEHPENSLAKVGSDPNYGYDVPPPKPKRLKNYYDSQEIEGSNDFDDNISLPQTRNDYFQNIPPSRPLRKTRYSQGSQEVPNVDDESDTRRHEKYFDDLDRKFYHDDEEIPEVKVTKPPPKVPKRRKRGAFGSRETKSMEKDSFINGFGGRSVSNSYIQNEDQPEEEAIVYRTEHQYTIPLATPEPFTDGTPTPMKSRSQSHFDDDRTSRGAESLMTDNMDQDGNMDEGTSNKIHEKFTIEMNENDGYAVVRKDSQNMPKPTPPARRKKFNRLTTERFATMPHMKSPPLTMDDDEELPERPTRGYSTIGPQKPPRRKSLTLAEDLQKSTQDVSEYEELEFTDELNERADSPINLKSGDVVNKMKYRPLPPPPRPPRDKFGRKSKDDDDEDRDGGGERLHILETIQSESDTDQTIVEVEVATQTDPLPDDFVCEEFEITDDMKIIEARPRARTVEDILREELEAEEFERVRQQLADEDTLSSGLNRFREANQRTLSERSRASSQADRSKSLSRPQTPSAIIIERRIPTPILNGSRSSIVVEASLTVQPLEDDDFEMEEEALRREGYLSEREDDRRDFEYLSETEDQKKQSEIKREEREWSYDKIEPEIEQIQSDRFKFLERERTEIARDLSYELSGTEEERDKFDEKTKKYKSSEEDDLEMYPPPVPPPRKRSSVTASEIAEVASRMADVSQTSVPAQRLVESSLPNRLAIADLEVDRLRVHALQAGQIMVSQLHGAQINADELECRSGNLVVGNIELPPGFIENIVERVRTTEREHIQIPVETQTTPSIEQISETITQETQTLQQTDEKPPEIPPPPIRQTVAEPTPVRPPVPQSVFPSEYMHSVPPASFYQLRSPDEEPMTPTRPSYFPPEFLQSIAPSSFYQLRNPGETDEEYQQRLTRRRRHHHHHRRRDSSTEEEVGEGGELRRHRSKSRQRHEQPQSVPEAGRELISACNASLIRRMNGLANYLRTTEKGDRSASTLMLIFLLLTIGFLILAIMGHDIHHHHWDFFNLPENNGRS